MTDINLPLVSVIVPALNEEYVLPRVLKAIRKQSYKNLKIIVVDSNSDDGTVKIAEKCGAHKIVMLKERGLSKARNQGAFNSKGDILMFVDADIRLNDRCVKTAVRCINSGFIGGSFRFRYDSNSFKAYFMAPFISALRKIYKVYGSVMFCTRKAFELMHEKYSVFDENLRAGEDCHFTKTLCSLGKTKVLRNFFYVDTRREEKKGYVGTLLEWRDIYSEMRNNGFKSHGVNRDYDYSFRRKQ